MHSVSDAYTLVTINDQYLFIFKLNQEFLDMDPTQNEALFQPYQMRAFNAMVYDYTRSHLEPSNKSGDQCIVVNVSQYDMYIDA